MKMKNRIVETKAAITEHITFSIGIYGCPSSVTGGLNQSNKK
jgi:hypothetical protein